MFRVNIPAYVGTCLAGLLLEVCQYHRLCTKCIVPFNKLVLVLISVLLYPVCVQAIINGDFELGTYNEADNWIPG